MGRPYLKELSELPATLAWSGTYELDSLSSTIRAVASHPLLVVGSGGSVSAAYLVARLHQSFARLPARVITPFEFILLPPDQLSAVLLLSGSGSNPDIINAAKHAATAEYPVVAAVVARTGSPLVSLLRGYRYGYCVEFAPPSGKDGFLATNSLLATVVLLTRTYGSVFNQNATPVTIPTVDHDVDSRALDRPLLTVLAAGWSWPAATDFESKCNEAGLGTVVCTDYRNFAHGRHYGLERRSRNTTVVAFVSPDCESVASATLKGLPSEVPVVRVSTESADATGAIELLLQTFELVGRIAARGKIDPGQPRVPDFGRKLYHMDIARLRRPKRARALERSERVDCWIRRKVGMGPWISASNEDRGGWRAEYEAWAALQRNANFGALVFDYDGTVCEADERYGYPNPIVVTALTRLIEAGLLVGVATGRGGSVCEALRAVLPPSHWPQVTVGLYNGAVLTTLAQDQPALNPTGPIRAVEELFAASSLLNVLATFKAFGPKQLTVSEKVPLPVGRLRQIVIEVLATKPDLAGDVWIHESGHSVDLICCGVSKMAVVDHLSAQLLAMLPDDNRKVLTIGDQGGLGGNDFALLSRSHSLSVHRVSSPLDRCWNLAVSGRRGSLAFTDYLNAMHRRPASEAFGLGIEELELGITAVKP